MKTGSEIVYILFVSAPAVSAEVAFRQSYSLYLTFERLEFKRCELQSATDFVTHTLATFGVCVAVFCEVFDTLRTLELVNNLSCD